MKSKWSFFLFLFCLTANAQVSNELSFGAGTNFPFYDRDQYTQYPFYPGLNLVAEFSVQNGPAGIGLMLSFQQFVHRSSTRIRRPWQAEDTEDVVEYHDDFSTYYSLAVPINLNFYNKNKLRFAFKGGASLNRYDQSSYSIVSQTGRSRFVKREREFYVGGTLGLSFMYALTENVSIQHEAYWNYYLMLFAQDWGKIDFNTMFVYRL